MARAPNQQGDVNRQAAEDTVFENLGLDPTELGTDDGADDLDTGQDDADDTGDDLDTGETDPFAPAQERVTHTQGEPTKPKPKPLPRRSEVKDDGKGNLVNAKGEIVARGGAQARLYQKAEKFRRQLSDSQAETTDLRSRLSRLAGVAKQLNDQVTANKGRETQLREFGITPQEQITAMQLFVELRDKPQEAIRRILTRAAANGINVAEIGQGGGIDAKSIADLVRSEVTKIVDPLRQRSDQQAAREQEQQRQNQVHQRAAEEVQAFFRRNPDAVPHASVFHRVLQDPRYRELSLGEIWVRISRNLTAQQGRQRNRTPGTGSLPNGRGTPPSAGGSGKIADPNASYESIIEGAMSEAGMPRSNRV